MTVFAAPEALAPTPDGTSRSRTAVIINFASRRPTTGFTARDLSELARWAGHGRRVALWESEQGACAQLYDGCANWANWAVSREGGVVIAWNAITLTDLGRFGLMRDALAAISTDDTVPEKLASNIIHFAPRPG